MNELAGQTEVKPLKTDGRKRETRVLSQLTALINTPEFSTDDGDGKFHAPPPEAIAMVPSQADQVAATRVMPTIPQAAAAATEAAGMGKRELPPRTFTTGRMKAGKDFILSHFGYRIHGFAEPLYALQEFFFGNPDKKLPGARQFLQKVGQWGRGMVTEQYPITTERAAFCQFIRILGGELASVCPSVDWNAFGTDDLWLNALLHRVQQEESARVGVSNVRFENEFHGLANAGWTHFHVMCSPETWAKRLKESGLNPKSAEVADTSERMAIALDADSLKSAKTKGGKLRIIWNDPYVRSPSPRFYTFNELA